MAESSEGSTRLADDQQMPKVDTLIGGRYRVINVLGEGGFAAVYKAFDERTRTDVAVKVLDPIMSRRKEFAARFRREVETCSHLRHHNTIKIYDTGETDTNCLFLVMELLRGRPLDKILEEEGPLPPNRVQTITTQILKSLNEAHQSGVIHRDLKPANVFIADLMGEKDYVKVLDFGIAKSLDESQDSSLTATGQIMCSPHYVAPERIKSQQCFPSSDLYSLGIMMIELLEGKPPYAGESPMSLAMNHLLPDPVPMAPPTAGGPLAEVIRKACAKDVTQRYQTAEEMLTALAALGRLTGRFAPVGSGSTSALAQPGSKSPTTDTLTRSAALGAQPASGSVELGELSPTKSRAPLIAVLALLILVGGVGAFLALRPAPAAPVADAPTATAPAPTDTPAEPAPPAQIAGASQTPPAPEEPPAAPTVPPEPVVPPVLIGTTPPGATLYAGDVILGNAPATVSPSLLPPFPFELRAELAGHEPAHAVVPSLDVLRSGLTLTLTPVAAPPTTPTQPSRTSRRSQSDSNSAPSATTEPAPAEPAPAEPAPAEQQPSRRIRDIRPRQ